MQVLMIFSLFACFTFATSTMATAASNADAAKLEKGKKVYQERCIFCHGDKGAGDGPAGSGFTPKPHNFTNHDLKLATIETALAKGKGSMPSFSDLSKEDREAVALCVSDVKKCL